MQAGRSSPPTANVFSLFLLIARRSLPQGEAPERGAGASPFERPAVNPWISDVRKASTNKITGIVMTTPSVASPPHWPTKLDWSSCPLA